MTTPVIPKRRGRPPKSETIVAVESIRQKCQYCSAEIAAGREPVIWGTCAECAKKEVNYEAEAPCPNCGGRKGMSVSGIVLKDGHRDNCITRATDITPRRKLTDEDVAEIRQRLGPAPVPFRG